jgi:hypothetical protein
VNPAARLSARRALDRVTGRSAITWWTWLATAPLALTVMPGVQSVSGRPGAIVAVGALEHVGVGVLLLAGWALLRVAPSRWRTLAVLVIFFAVGALRPLLFLAAGAVLRIPAPPGEMSGRIFIDIVATVTSFSLVAAGVALVREHLGVYRRLLAAQRASARNAECAVARITALRRSAVDDVLEKLEDATAAASAHRIRPEEAARLLRGLAEEVVRPASHRLFDGEVALPGEPAAEPRVRGRDWAAAVLLGMHPAPALPLALLIAAVVTPFGVWQYGLLFCLPPLLCGFAVIWAANAALAVLVERTPPGFRAGALLAGYSVVGVLLSLTTRMVISTLGGEPRLVWFEAVSYPVIGTGVALVASLSTRIRRDQSALEAAVLSNVRAAADIQTAFDHEREALARLLHSGVQSELIAAALSLGAGSAEDASGGVRDVVRNIRAELSAPHREPDPAERIAALVESWGSAIALRPCIADGVWERLRQPGRAGAVIDAISEGLANAVRHGDGTPVTLDVRPAPAEGVSVVVVSGGALAAERPGIGLRQLGGQGDVVLRESAGRVELSVAIP